MSASRILTAQFFSVLLLAVLTWLAVSYSLYWHFWWFDIPMHLLGGLWAGLCAAWLVARRGYPLTLTWCLVFALFVGVGWEVFEYIEKIAQPQYLDYWPDTVKDIVMDILGAGIGYVIAKRLLQGEREAAQG